MQLNVCLGVIDEIEKRPLGPLPEDLAKDKSKLDHYFSPKKASTKPTHGYVIVDHKTRYAAKMPSFAFSKPYRVQLMLYKKLFDTLAKDEFQWDFFLAFHGVEKETILSDHFIVQILPIFLSVHNMAALPTSWSLEAICEVLRQAFLTIGPLQENMELIYRSRTAKKTKPKKGKGKSKKAEDSPIEPIVIIDDEAADVVASGSAAVEEEEIESQAIVPIALPPATPKSSQSRRSAPNSSPEGDVGRVIGVEKFMYDETELDAWTGDMLSFWRSQREARGVCLYSLRPLSFLLVTDRWIWKMLAKSVDHVNSRVVANSWRRRVKSTLSSTG